MTLPDVVWDDDEIRWWAYNQKIFFPKTYVELSGAIHPNEPDMAEISWDLPKFPVKRYKKINT